MIIVSHYSREKTVELHFIARRFFMLAAQKIDDFQDENYMNQTQLEFFHQKLVSWRDELLGVSDNIMSELKETTLRNADPVDSGSLHAEKELSLITKQRNAQLIQQIEHALSRIKDGEYGFCEMTGEKIGIQRLKIMPLTTLTKDAQEELERRDRSFS